MPWIATRVLTEESGSAKITVKLGMPEPVSEDEWRCAYQVKQGRSGKVRHAHGVDAFQALLLALTGIRLALDQSGRTLTWVGGELGDTGFPRFVPQHYGLDFSRRLEQWIAQEVERFEAERGARRR